MLNTRFVWKLVFTQASLMRYICGTLKFCDKYIDKPKNQAYNNFSFFIAHHMCKKLMTIFPNKMHYWLTHIINSDQPWKVCSNSTHRYYINQLWSALNWNLFKMRKHSCSKKLFLPDRRSSMTQLVLISLGKWLNFADAINFNHPWK